jgi:hypothetical protein
MVKLRIVRQDEVSKRLWCYKEEKVCLVQCTKRGHKKGSKKKGSKRRGQVLNCEYFIIEKGQKEGVKS